MFDLNGKVALVTGASRGIGAMIAQVLGEAGATVIGTATTETGAASIDAYLATRSIQGRGMILDVTQQEQINQVITSIQLEYKEIDILVNNAGIVRDQLFLRLKEDDWNLVMETNLNGVFRMTKACIKGMIKKRSGRIINITSVSGFIGNPGQTNYAAAKAGLVGFTRSLASEVGSRGITVNCVAPGFITTDMTKSISDTHADLLVGQIPLQRMGRPEEIAHGVLFLASSAASYITGETLHINGGMYMA